MSEQGSRKVLYQKIVAAFPEGWMSSGQISRDGGLWWWLFNPVVLLMSVFSEFDEEEI